MRSGLVLPQLNGPGFVESASGPLPLGRNGWGVNWVEGAQGGVRERTVFRMQNQVLKNKLKKIIKCSRGFCPARFSHSLEKEVMCTKKCIQKEVMYTKKCIQLRQVQND